MKTTPLLTLCMALSFQQLLTMNIRMMAHEDEDMMVKQVPSQQQLSADMRKLMTAQNNLNWLQANQKGVYLQLDSEYQEQLAMLEELAKSSTDAEVQRNAHFILGCYAYHGYRPSYRTLKPHGISFKKALVHLTHVTQQNKLAPAQDYLDQQAQAHHIMGNIYRRGETCLFGCLQRVKVDQEKALAHFTLAHCFAENNDLLKSKISEEIQELHHSEE